MSHALADSPTSTWVESTVRTLLGIGFAVTFAAIALVSAIGHPEWYRSDTLLLGYLSFVGVAMAGVAATSDEWDRRVTVSGLSCLVLLAGVVLVLRGPGFTPPDRPLQLAGVVLLFVLAAAVVRPGGPALDLTFGYVLVFGVLVAAHVWHAAALPAGSGLGTFPIRTGLWLLVGLFFVPRVVSTDAFLWGVAGVTSLLVAVAVPALVLGTYPLFWLEIGVRAPAFGLPVVGPVPVLESVFANPNTFGIATFAGTFTALVVFARARDDPWTRSVAALLVVVNAVGLLLSGSRASFLAFAVGAGIYLSSLALGRRVLPAAVGATVGAVGLFLAGIAVGILPFDPSGRFTLWVAAVETVASEPSVVGRGIVDVGEVIAPNVPAGPYRGHSPHNSYLSVFIRAGFAGGLAYLVLTVGSLADGARRWRRVDPAMLSLAVAFGVHQLFESYTLYHHTLGAVLATLSVGYLVRTMEMGSR